MIQTILNTLPAGASATEATGRLGRRARALLFFFLCLLVAAWAPALHGQAIISEFMAGNHSGLTDEDGETSDWIEIYNTNSTAVDLVGWHLTDEAGDLAKWTFPSTPLPARGFVLVWASGKNRAVSGQPLHASFKLDAAGGYLALTRPDDSIASDFAPAYPEQVDDISYGVVQQVTTRALLTNNPALRVLVPTNGALGTSWTARTYDHSAWRLGTNGAGYQKTVHTGASYAALIKTVLLSSMTNKNATAYIRFPFTVTNTAVFQSLTLRLNYDDGFIAWLNGVEVARRSAPASPAWNSTATATQDNTLAIVGESFDLTPWLGQLVAGTNVLAFQGLNDSINGDDFLISAQLADYRVTLSTNQYFGAATPGGFNTTQPYFLKVADTKFDHDRGFYETNFSLVITCATPGATLRYTRDGSAPTLTTGTVYTNGFPIAISNTTTLRAAGFKTGYSSSDVDTQTYLFIRDVLGQREGVAPGPGWPPAGRYGNQNQILDYGLASDVVSNLTYSGEVSNDLRAIPTFSIVMNLDGLFNVNTGIYVNANTGFGVDLESPCSLELIHPNGTPGFQANCGIRTRGGYSRSGDNPKHGFRIFFSSQYGQGQLNYPLFGTTNGAVTSFDKFDLRTFQNYSWSFGGDSRFHGMRDQFSRDMQLALGSPGSHGQYYHLYINGHYWGIYNTDERPEENFGASYFGGTADQYDVIKTSGDNGYNIYATAGNLDAWLRLWRQATNGFPDLDAYMRVQGRNRDGTRNPTYENLLEVDNLIDYMLVHLYSGDIDAPISAFLGNNSPNNIFCLRNTNNLCGGYRFVTHDAEHTLLYENLSVDRFGPFAAGDPVAQGAGAFSKSSPGYLFTQMLKNPEFKVRLADRVQKYLLQRRAHDRDRQPGPLQRPEQRTVPRDRAGIGAVGQLQAEPLLHPRRLVGRRDHQRPLHPAAHGNPARPVPLAEPAAFAGRAGAEPFAGHRARRVAPGHQQPQPHRPDHLHSGRLGPASARGQHRAGRAGLCRRPFAADACRPERAGQKPGHQHLERPPGGGVLRRSGFQSAYLRRNHVPPARHGARRQRSVRVCRAQERREPDAGPERARVLRRDCLCVPGWRPAGARPILPHRPLPG